MSKKQRAGPASHNSSAPTAGPTTRAALNISEFERDGVVQVVAADHIDDEGQAGRQVQGVDDAGGGREHQHVPGGELSAPDDGRQPEGLGQKGGLGEHDEPAFGQRSARAPPQAPSSSVGNTCAATTNPAQSALSVRSQASHVRAVVCTQLPVSDTSCP